MKKINLITLMLAVFTISVKAQSNNEYQKKFEAANQLMDQNNMKLQKTCG